MSLKHRGANWHFSKSTNKSNLQEIKRPLKQMVLFMGSRGENGWCHVVINQVNQVANKKTREAWYNSAGEHCGRCER